MELTTLLFVRVNIRLRTKGGPFALSYHIFRIRSERCSGRLVLSSASNSHVRKMSATPRRASAVPMTDRIVISSLKTTYEIGSNITGGRAISVEAIPT